MPNVCSSLGTIGLVTIAASMATAQSAAPLVQRLDSTIPQGMYALLGPNGAGKSTLMRIVATLQEPDAGSISLVDSLERGTTTRARVLANEIDGWLRTLIRQLARS